MNNNYSLDPRLSLPYSIGTGIPKGGETEIAGYLESLRTQGFCAIETANTQRKGRRGSRKCLLGRRLLEQDRQIEKQKRVELEKERLNRDGKSAIEITEPVRPPVAPNAELCDIARNETFAKHRLKVECYALQRLLWTPTLEYCKRK